MKQSGKTNGKPGEYKIDMRAKINVKRINYQEKIIS
jgi:hypothetical protein